MFHPVLILPGYIVSYLILFPFMLNSVLSCGPCGPVLFFIIWPVLYTFMSWASYSILSYSSYFVLSFLPRFVLFIIVLHVLNTPFCSYFPVLFIILHPVPYLFLLFILRSVLQVRFYKQISVPVHVIQIPFKSVISLSCSFPVLSYPVLINTPFPPPSFQVQFYPVLTQTYPSLSCSLFLQRSCQDLSRSKI